MKLCKLGNFAGAASLAVLLCSTASFAEVTTKEVWNDWSKYLQDFGYEITAVEEQSGNTLKITEFKAVSKLPENGGTVEITLSGLELTDQGDGTVALAIPEHNPITINLTPQGQDGEAMAMEFDFFHKGLAITVSGSKEEMIYDSAAPELGIRLVSMMIDGKPLENTELLVSINDITDRTVSRLGDLRTVEQTGTAASLSYKIGLSDPESDTQVNITGQMDNLAVAGMLSAPPDQDLADLAAALRAGATFSVSFGYGSGESEVVAEEAGKITTFASSAGEGSLEIAMGADGILYDVVSKGGELVIASPDLPFPQLVFRFAENGGKLKMPLLKSEEPQDFALAFRVIDLEIPSEIWMIGDPGGALPQDPVTVVFDTSGKGRWFVDILDPAMMAGLEDSDQPPGEVTEVMLNALQVKAVGAELSGDGAFEIRYNGVPKPVGQVNLKLVGVNALIDKLIQMGLVPEDQAMGIRMMLGMFAQPGEGEDELVSTIEFTEEGHILANGQRLQ